MPQDNLLVDRILGCFPPHTHPLTLASDPDGLLADEMVVAELLHRGFALVSEADPVHLRYRVEQARPFTREKPVIVAAATTLEELPYDLWQHGRRLVLALHTFFPNLSYPVVQALTPAQRAELGRATPPPQPLGRQASLDYVLMHFFDAAPEALGEPAGLVSWLARYHRRSDPMPEMASVQLLRRLRSVTAYTAWPLEDLLASREGFANFLQHQWRVYLQRETGRSLGEDTSRYLLSFEQDNRLQDCLPALVRDGTLAPVEIPEPDRLPSWVRPAVLSGSEDRDLRRADELLSLIREFLASPTEKTLWPVWQEVASAWAEFDLLRHSPRSPIDSTREAAASLLQGPLDDRFCSWLLRYYAALGGRRLPDPHHVHHVPHYLAYRRRQGEADRVALLIADGMALSDWLLIGRAWRARHPDWTLEDRLLLAQIPAITCVSRQALVSGQRPADFSAILEHNRAESREWAAFWRAEGLSAEACPYRVLGPSWDLPTEVAAVERTLVRAACVVYGGLDDLAHGSTLGEPGVQAALQPWVVQESPRIEVLVEALLTQGFTVYVTSDHGHVEAQGMGQPSEGVLVQTRSKRARLYDQRSRALAAQQSFPNTVIWGDDGLLPEGRWALMPSDRSAFATFGELVVTHGGLTIEEMMVPLVTITKRQA